MISPSQRPVPDNTQQTNIHAPGGIRTHNLSRRAAEDLRLRPRGHWYRQATYLDEYIKLSIYTINIKYVSVLFVFGDKSLPTDRLTVSTKQQIIVS